jgi:hypothetical protein
MPPFQPEPVNVIPNAINQLIELLDVIPEDGPIQKPQGAGVQVAWQNLEVGKSYWALSTGFACEGAEPRCITVTEVTQFPDGGAMILTDVPQWAYGVGAYCEGAVGPRNRFWHIQV